MKVPSGRPFIFLSYPLLTQYKDTDNKTSRRNLVPHSVFVSRFLRFDILLVFNDLIWCKFKRSLCCKRKVALACCRWIGLNFCAVKWLELVCDNILTDPTAAVTIALLPPQIQIQCRYKYYRTKIPVLVCRKDLLVCVSDPVNRG